MQKQRLIKHKKAEIHFPGVRAIEENGMIGVIGGSGLYQIHGIEIRRTKKIITPFGEPSAPFIVGHIGKKKVIFLARHGVRHTIPPHRINYRANIWGLKELGVKRLILIGATGGIRKGMPPGTLVVLDQIIDMTNGREGTFFDGKTGVYHVDFTEPYCRELRTIVLKAGRKMKLNLKKTGTYVCTNGPRLETRAETMFFSKGGADVVGMTAMPEAALAREAEMCCAGIAVVTNYAPGIGTKKLTATEVIEVMRRTSETLKTLLQETITLIPSERHCTCKESLNQARV